MFKRTAEKLVDYTAKGDEVWAVTFATPVGVITMIEVRKGALSEVCVPGGEEQ